MNRGYNEERYRPLDDDRQNQQQTSQPSRSNEPASTNRGAADEPNTSPHPTQPETKQEEEDNGEPEQ